MGVASLVLGIISLIISVCGGFAAVGWVGSICAIVAIVLGVIARKTAATRGQGTAGLICGIIALVWGLLATLACAACFTAIGAAALSGL